MRIGKKDFDFDRKSYVMGILNVTPDSFSDGGSHMDTDRALTHALKMIVDGAAIIDVGGESTRPGYEEVPVQEEIERVVPVIRALKKNTDAVVSLDTCKHQVARAGIEAGADMINDIWGLRRDQGEMAGLIARTGLPCCLMHNRESIFKENHAGKPESGREESDREGDGFLGIFCKEMEESLRIAERAGIHRDRIILDPGIGFGKSYEQNLLMMKNLMIMNQWKCPILLGTSRKSMIGISLDLPVHEREEGTLATTVIGRMAGASIFRVHNVKANVRALKMTDAIAAC